MKEEKLYVERYNKPGLKHIKAPEFHSKEMKCVEAYTIEAGIVKRGKEELEYQIVKVYFVKR